MSRKSTCAFGADDPVSAASSALIAFLDKLTDVSRPETMESLAATDLTFSQFRTLCALACHSGPMPVNALADRVELSFAAAGRTVDKLVSSGLVDRREDPADRRVKRISLTAEGQSFLESHFAVAHETVRRFVTALPAELRDNLRAALSPIVDDEVDYFRPPAESGHRAP